MTAKKPKKEPKKSLKRKEAEELEELEELEEELLEDEKEDKDDFDNQIKSGAGNKADGKNEEDDEDDEDAEPRRPKKKKQSEKKKAKGFPFGGLILMFLLIAVILAAGYFGMEYMDTYAAVKSEFDTALKAAESERDAAAAVYAEEDPESAGNVAIRKQVTEEMIAEANAEIDALREQSEETDAAIRVAEEKIAELQGVEGYDYYRAIYDEYVEGRAYVEDLLSGD